MTSYVLVQDRQIVLLGPMEWRQRMFQAELKELNISYQLPIKEDGYIPVTETVEIFPVMDTLIPTEYDPMFDELVGPTWSFFNYGSIATYSIRDGDLNGAKSGIKGLLANVRYEKENTPFKMTVQNQQVTVDASRDNRNIFIQKYSMMGDNDIVEWKFPEGWLQLTKPELGQIVQAGANYIQEQFAWEYTISNQIDAATTRQELKDILDIINPPPVPPTPLGE